MLIRLSCKSTRSMSLSLCVLFGIVATAGAQPATTGATTRAVSYHMPSAYEKWLNEDVLWIITPGEHGAFVRLSNDRDRDVFVEQFWIRRDPTPGTAENEFKE